MWIPRLYGKEQECLILLQTEKWFNCIIYLTFDAHFKINIKVVVVIVLKVWQRCRILDKHTSRTTVIMLVHLLHIWNCQIHCSYITGYINLSTSSSDSMHVFKETSRPVYKNFVISYNKLAKLQILFFYSNILYYCRKIANLYILWFSVSKNLFQVPASNVHILIFSVLCIQ